MVKKLWFNFCIPKNKRINKSIHFKTVFLILTTKKKKPDNLGVRITKMPFMRWQDSDASNQFVPVWVPMK